MKHLSLCLGFCLLGTLLFLTACSKEQNVRAATTTVKVEPPQDPDVFTVDKPGEFALVPAETRRVHDDIQANGVVAADVSRTVPVTSLTGGRVLEIGARLGDVVHKGQVLLKIASNDLAGAFSDYQKAIADELLARRALNRSKDLFEHGAAAQKDLESAEAAEQKAQVDLKTTAERIRLLGGSVDHPTSVVNVLAPVSGTIVDQQIQAAGGVKSLDNSPNLFTIADLSRVWILCDVYENNLAQVRPGDVAEIRLSAYPDRVFKARISNISSLLDATTRTAKVRLELPNSGGIMRPGMFAVARFFSQTVKERVVLPAAAILRLHDKDWIFRPLGGNAFRRVEIQGAETSADGFQFVHAGIQPGEQVVKNALQFSSSAAEK